MNGTAVLLKDTRSSETEKADEPQPIKEIQREDPIEASSVWGIILTVFLLQEIHLETSIFVFVARRGRGVLRA